MHRPSAFRTHAASLAASLVTVLALTAAPAIAGEVVDAATAVEAAVAAGDFDAWQKANGDLLAKAWAQPGLHFNHLVLVTAPAAGYGVYDVRPDSIYAQGEPILVYAEPEGYGFGTLATGQMEIAFGIDLKVLDPGGAVLVEMPDFLSIKFQSWQPAHEFVANLSVSMGSAPPGDYQLEFTFRDLHGGQNSSFTTNVSVK